MSYVRSVDEHDEGRLTELRKRLSGEVRVQTGQEFPIFQDRNDILWGQQWKERIDESLDEVTFLIPIITPGFFKSDVCGDELRKFLEREKKLGRNDLILPVYYVDCPLLNDKEKRATDELAETVAERQYADWRDLRFEPLTSSQVCRVLAKLAVQIRDALERGERLQEETSTPPIRARGARQMGISAQEVSQSVSESYEAARKPYAKIEPPTHVVDAMYRGDYATISEAIEAADPGDRIIVRPGLYQEGLVIDKPLEIIGDGKLEEIMVQAGGENVLLFRTTMGRAANLTLRQIGGGEWYCVSIGQGCLELMDCDVTSLGSACVGIHGNADPRLRRNRIHDGKASGVFVYENGQGTLEDNEIFANAYAGVEIKAGGNPTLRRNRIHDGKSAGVFVYENGQGTLEDNEIFANALAGVAIKAGGNPTLRHNRINKNGYGAIWVYEGGAGTIEDNDLRDNARAAWDISEDSEPNLKRERNLE